VDLDRSQAIGALRQLPSASACQLLAAAHRVEPELAARWPELVRRPFWRPL
jgi:hypothetical protein